MRTKPLAGAAVAASLLALSAAAQDDPKCRPTSAESAATPPFLIGFIAELEPDTKKTVLKPYVYKYDPKTMRLVTDSKTGKLVYYPAAGAGGITPLPVSGALCAMSSVAVNRFWNHEVFFAIKIGNWEWKIKLDHPEPHPDPQ